MAKYIVRVTRTSYCEHDFEVEAENFDDAEYKAAKLASNHDFSLEEVDFDFDIEDVRRVQDCPDGEERPTRADRLGEEDL